MPKQTVSLGLNLAPRKPGMSAYTWLYSVMREDILSRRLPAGTRLPPTRELAAQYQLARGTIVAAFEQLKAGGYLEGVMGSGTYVSKVLPRVCLMFQLLASKGLHFRDAAIFRTSDTACNYSRITKKLRRAPFAPIFRRSTYSPWTPWAQTSARLLREVSGRPTARL
jgi:DNA-binding GntR family transcriptional regulator